MNSYIKTCGIILCIIMMKWNISCSDLILRPDPGNSPETIFELVWDDFDKTYSYFIEKKIDWDSLYHIYRPMVTASTTESELFQILSMMIYELRDGHVSLFTPFAVFSYDEYYTKYPRNFLDWHILRTNYLHIERDSHPVRYGTVRGHSIGYIWIESFVAEVQKYAVIDNIIQKYGNLDGIIIDVRNNGGGSDINSEYIASRFADTEYIYGYYRYRVGPRHSDFGHYFTYRIKPDGDRQYFKPVVVLTNRRSFSATEGFVMSMKCFPHVTVIGDTTGGGAGNPIMRGLPNGWVYRLSRWIAYDRNKVSYEGIGIAPDIAMKISEADSIARRDTILETAIQWITDQNLQLDILAVDEV